MAKRVVYHYVKMVECLVPDECPTDSLQGMQLWLVENDKQQDTINEDTRDYEIVEVDDEPEEDGLFYQEGGRIFIKKD